jgi:hypothetical protein
VVDEKEKEEYNEKSAGSGSLAPLGYYPLDISNPRVLSDMGLAIPRPTRFPPALAGLGDPRALSGLFEIIISFCSLAPAVLPVPPLLMTMKLFDIPAVLGLIHDRRVLVQSQFHKLISLLLVSLG